MDISDKIQLAIVLLTFLAVVVALFGEYLRQFMLRPKLNIELARKVGERASFNDGVSARYYHLRVVNSRPLVPAEGVQVLLSRLDTIDADGVSRTSWVGEVPMRWRSQEVFPLTPDIGPAKDCDLLFLRADKQLELCPLIYPNNLTCRWRSAVKFMMVLQVVHRHGAGEKFSIHVRWNGNWVEGERELLDHFKVELIQTPVNTQV